MNRIIKLELNKSHRKRSSRFITNSLVLLVLTLIIPAFEMKAAKPDAPENLRCMDKINPVGTNEHPYFGWYVSDADENEIQTAYQILVASSKEKLDDDIGDVWDSQKVESLRQNYLYYQGKELNATRLYYWKVRTWDKDGNVSPYSDVAKFSTGLLANYDWTGAKWIKRNTKDADDYTYYRKKLALEDKAIKRATVYISACHSYILYVNGKLVGKGYNHHYPQYSYYQTWDITSFVSKDEDNLFACLSHWYGGGQGRAKGARGLLVKAIVEYADSTTTTLVSDDTWKQTRAKQWAPDQPQRNGEGIGRIEKIDSRKSIKYWNEPSFDDSKWESATEIGSHPTAPWNGNLTPDLTRLIEKEIKPVSIDRLNNGNYVIDLGQIYAGSFKIHFKGGEEGQTVKMTGGFVLNEDGSVSMDINQRTNLDFEYIHNGSSFSYNPHVYLGIRYLEVQNSPCNLNSFNVRFVTRHYELDREQAQFESSNDMLNKVWELMVHSLMVGAQEGFVDTPTREKGTFLGDSWLQAVPCMSVLNDRTMNLKSLHEFMQSQDQYWSDGRLNAVYPNVDGGRDIPDFTLMYLIWVWDYYMQTGNTEFLQENYTRFKKIAEYVDTYRNKHTGLIEDLKGGKGPYKGGIIDWPEDMRYGYDMNTSSRTVIEAYAYRNFQIMGRIAEVLGKQSDMITYQSKTLHLGDAINQYLVNADGVYIDGLYKDFSPSKHVSQHANILPFSFDIAPLANYAAIIDEIKQEKMSVGMICLRWLPEALGKANEGQHLLELYTNTEWDGWAKNITQGATVTWETWNSLEKNESLSHPWGAVGLLGIQNYMLGVKPLSPQLDTIQIKPLDFGSKLNEVEGVYHSDKGEVYVHWKRSKDHITIKVEIPANMVANVYLPKLNDDSEKVAMNRKTVKGVIEGDYVYLPNVGSGEYTFRR